MIEEKVREMVEKVREMYSRIVARSQRCYIARSKAVITKDEWQKRNLELGRAQEPHARIVICGSLYLAGMILRQNG